MPALSAMDGGGGGSYDPRRQAIQNQREVSNYRPAPPPPPAPPIQASSTGQYSRPSAVPASNPGPIQQLSGNDLEAYLGGDSGYQQQLRQLGQALADFTADATRRKGSLETDFATSQKAMADQRLLDLDMLKDDYGARGLLRSGLYADSVGKYETEFNTRNSDLQRRQQEAMGALTQEQGRFSSQQELQKQAARESAIRRRAESLGV
jgi:hypothetical protein